MAEAGRTSVRVVIEGRVHGVGYRDWASGAARGLRLNGWVRNLADGTVEAVFAGSPEAVDAMVERCAQGPRFARVRRVRRTQGPADVPAGFTIAPDG